MLDEKIAWGLQELIGTLSVTGPLGKFETNYDKGCDCVAAKKAWKDLWFVPARADGSPAQGIVPNALRVPWQHFDKGGPLSNSDWISIFKNTGIDFSCSKLAKVYSKRTGCKLTCPNLGANSAFK